jgi:hypothetical protein
LVTGFFEAHTHDYAQAKEAELVEIGISFGVFP